MVQPAARALFAPRRQRLSCTGSSSDLTSGGGQRMTGWGDQFHLAELYRVAGDNIARNLHVGRSANFPGQLR